jgi:hypothetical protein
MIAVNNTNTKSASIIAIRGAFFGTNVEKFMHKIFVQEKDLLKVKLALEVISENELKYLNLERLAEASKSDQIKRQVRYHISSTK